MALKGAIARRYAEAVFGMGKDQGTIESWRSDIIFLNSILSDRRLAFLLKEPKVPFTTKEAIIRDLAGSKIQKDAIGLGLLIVEHHLVDYMPRIMVEFERLYDEFHNQAKAFVTTAVPLDAAGQNEVIQYLQKLTGKNITIEARVDPTILGGVIARIGDTLIDGSVRQRLEVLREKLVSGVDIPPAR